MIAGEGFVRLPTNTAWSADRMLKAFGADALALIPLRSTRPKGARGRNLQSRSAPPERINFPAARGGATSACSLKAPTPTSPPRRRRSHQWPSVPLRYPSMV